MIQGENQLTEEKKKLLKQGTKVKFKWYGNKDLVYIGFIEVNEFGELYFCNDHNYKDGKLTEIGKTLQYYNRLDGFTFFTYFEILYSIRKIDLFALTTPKVAENLTKDEAEKLKDKLQTESIKECGCSVPRFFVSTI